jgi:predicted Zn-dependent protease
MLTGMKSYRVITLGSAVVLLSACAINNAPPPVVEAGDPPPPVVRDETQAPAPPDATAATRSLLAAAETATEANNHSTAISYLERAVRLDPRNPQLWLRLSQAHLADGNLPAATQHARKALALGSRDPAITRSAWLQLAAIKDAQGDKAEADAIRRQYRTYQG